MEKRKFNFAVELPENVKIVYKGEEIEIKPYLSLLEQAELTKMYVQNYFFPDKSGLPLTGHDLLTAEYALRLDIIQLVTNIDVEELNPNVFFFDSDFFEKITDVVSNYDEFRWLLGDVLDDVNKYLDRQASVGEVIKNLGEKLSKMLESMGSMKPEDIDSLKDIAFKLGEQLATPAVSAIVSDSQRGKQDAAVG